MVLVDFLMDANVTKHKVYHKASVTDLLEIISRATNAITRTIRVNQSDCDDHIAA